MINIYEVNHGGNVAYHGSGQLAGKFFFLRKHVRNIKKFIRNIQQVFIFFLKEYKIEGRLYV